MRLKCQEGDHQDGIETICYNQFCSEYRLNSFQFIKECDDLIEDLNQFVESLNQSFSVLKRGIREKYSLQKEKIIKLNSQDNKVIKEIQKHLQSSINSEQYDLLMSDQIMITNQNISVQENEQIQQSNNQQIIINKENTEKTQLLVEMREKENQLQNDFQDLQSQNFQLKKDIQQQIEAKDGDNKRFREEIDSVQKEIYKQNTQFEKDIQKLENLIKVKDEDIGNLKGQIESINQMNIYLEKSLYNFNPNYRVLNKILLSQFQQQLTFSPTHKETHCQVTQNGKIVENGNFCLCNQTIPKNEVTQFAFKIIQLNTVYCYIGIGNLEIIQKNQFCSGVGCGTGSYLIRPDKLFFSNHEQDKNGQQSSFEFKTNDVITIEVDMKNKNIKWTNLDSNQSFTAKIETNYDYQPCAWVGGNKLQILQQII
ncbi:unnamed protein product [Paramecium octaurelia]|uniref:Uncharacterized protein n=1 Tax=Paramecium octaurelia TaxID=43137 RepID=A0A8S1XAC2_PAROT|nr:unnamed protein product [Paramecium octaurelia]